MNKKLIHLLGKSTPLLALLILVGCGRKPPGGAEGKAAPPPLEVGVLKIVTAPVTLTKDLPGRTSAFRVAEVRARVNGIVLKRLFKEGSDVKEGQPLYEIDPAPYEASLNSAKATLARAEANLASAEAKDLRYKQLANVNAVSRQDFEDAQANLGTFQAEVQSGQAAVQSAQIDLGYTHVVSPVAGRIGLSQVTEGAYVRASDATLLAIVQQLDPVYVDVTQASNEVLRLKRELADGKLKTDEEGHAKVKLILEDGAVYPEEGKFQVADVTVNPQTSSVTLRAIFPNPNLDLLPGMYVRARLEEGSRPDAILVPQLAVTRNTKGQPTALVVGPDDKAELRVLQTARAVGNQWLVTDGLKPGDQLIVDNLQKVRPGSPVKPVEAKLPPAFLPPATDSK